MLAAGLWIPMTTNFSKYSPTFLGRLIKKIAARVMRESKSESVCAVNPV